MEPRHSPPPLVEPSLAADLVTCDLLCSPLAFTTAGIAELIVDDPAAAQNPFLFVLVAVVLWLPASWFACGLVGLVCLIKRRTRAATGWATFPILHLLAAAAYVAAFFWFEVA